RVWERTTVGMSEEQLESGEGPPCTIAPELTGDTSEGGWWREVVHLGESLPEDWHRFEEGAPLSTTSWEASEYEVAIRLSKDGTEVSEGPVLAEWELLAAPVPERYVDCVLPLMMDAKVSLETGSPVAMDLHEEYVRLQGLARDQAPVTVTIGKQVWSGQMLGVDINPSGRQNPAVDGYQGELVAKLRFFGPPGTAPTRPSAALDAALL
ncbi:MAG: hypothetical protein OXG44_12760, partial [Gammaproteobacteria bacterium]|nr:hypothetical protein [Gammaproteobacteria bacterium]